MNTGHLTPLQIQELGHGRIVEYQRGAVTHIELPTPPMGGKCLVLKKKGIFVLERGPGVLRTIACTHAGAGTLEAVDGFPDDGGFFPDENLPEPQAADFKTPPDYLAGVKGYAQRRGRALYTANPVVMGSWMLDAGFLHGLTIRVTGGHESALAIASVVWMPVPQRVLNDIARRAAVVDHAGPAGTDGNDSAGRG